ncbi:MAG: complex I NDUFA9 subunit family protein [bacterium]
MKVFVTGGTGFVGGCVVAELLKRNHEVGALVRTPAKAAVLEKRGVKIIPGDVTAPPIRGMKGCDAVIHLVGIIREKPPGITFDKVHAGGTANVVEAARAAGVARFVHMSALGTREGAASRYHKSKLAGERAVIDTGIPYTIFRPSVIFGPGDEFLTMIKGFYRNPLFVPVIGGGNYRLQPVHVRDVACLFAGALESKGAENRIFEVGGPESYSFSELLEEVGRRLGKKRLKFHVPTGVAFLMARAFEKALPSPPLTTDQLIMLREDNVCDPAGAAKVFGVSFTGLREGMKEYIF